MTAYELSEKKIHFKCIENELYEMEPDADGRFILTSDKLNIFANIIQEGIEIINEYLKEKG